LGEIVSKNSDKPQWAPKDAGAEFATKVMHGVSGGHDGMPGKAGTGAQAPTARPRRRRLSVEEYVEGVLGGDRNALGQAITLVESNAVSHMEMAQDVLRRVIPHSGRSIRIGITGVPGAGKSTFIEAIGLYLCEQGHRVAVLAVDPSSKVTGGSILGDKTRMEQLSRDERAFIRPSPSSGTLGGVTRKSRETILVCEAAGFDVILVETVGVGQSETTVRSMVDFFLLVMIAGAGDELQGIKKGIMELADARLFVLVADRRGNPRNLERDRGFSHQNHGIRCPGKASARSDPGLGLFHGRRASAGEFFPTRRRRAHPCRDRARRHVGPHASHGCGSAAHSQV
jgi:LAO/AO transport system kinase